MVIDAIETIRHSPLTGIEIVFLVLAQAIAVALPGSVFESRVS